MILGELSCLCKIRQQGVLPVADFFLPFFRGVIFGSNSRILDISRWLYIQFLTRNPNFRSKITRFYSQEGKHRKNEFRKKSTKSLYVPYIFLFLPPPEEMDREVIYPSTVSGHKYFRQVSGGVETCQDHLIS